MSLDQELRSVLQQAADRCETREPDFDALIAGGRVVRHRQQVGRAVAGAAVAAVLAAGSGIVVWNAQTANRSGLPADTNPSWYRSPTQTISGQIDPKVMPFFLDLSTGKQTPVPSGLAPDGVGMAGMNVHPVYDVSPDGRRVTFNTCHSGSCSSADKLFVANLDGSDLREIQLPEYSDGYRPEWSPDGTKLVYQLRNGSYTDVGNLVIQDVVTGRRNQITDLELTASWWFLYPSFSPDGQNVIFQLPRSGSGETIWDAWSVPITGGEPTLVQRNATLPVYLPEGKGIAFVESLTTGGGSSIQIADAQGYRRTLVEANKSISWLTVSPDGTRIAYRHGGSINVVEVSTGESSKVAVGEAVEWVDDGTLLVSPAPR